MARLSIPCALVAALTGGAAAIDVPLGGDQIGRALTLARWPTSDAERATFHARYVFAVKGPNNLLVGGLVEARFDANAIGQASRPIVVRSIAPDAELARVIVNFRQLE